MHQHLDAGIEAGGDGVVQNTFKALLLAHDGVQKVGLVHILRNLLVKVDLCHALDRVADVDKLKELEERGNRCTVALLRRLVREHLLSRTGSSAWEIMAFRAS